MKLTSEDDTSDLNINCLYTMMTATVDTVSCTSQLANYNKFTQHESHVEPSIRKYVNNTVEDDEPRSDKYSPEKKFKSFGKVVVFK